MTTRSNHKVVEQEEHAVEKCSTLIQMQAKEEDISSPPKICELMSKRVRKWSTMVRIWSKRVI